MEYFRVTHTAGLFSAVFIARDVTQARGPLINNFHSLSDISSGKTLPSCENATTWGCVCVRVCQKYANESALLPEAPNGINEGNEHEHVCSINSVIIGSCESVFISIHWNNLAQKTDKKKLWSCLFFITPFFSPALPFPCCSECVGNVNTQVQLWDGGAGINLESAAVSWG